MCLSLIVIMKCLDMQFAFAAAVVYLSPNARLTMALYLDLEKASSLIHSSQNKLISAEMIQCMNEQTKESKNNLSD